MKQHKRKDWVQSVGWLLVIGWSVLIYVDHTFKKEDLYSNICNNEELRLIALCRYQYSFFIVQKQKRTLLIGTKPLSQPHRALPSLLPPFPAYQCPPHWTRGGIVDAGRICVNPHLLEPSPCPSSIHSKKLFHLCIGSSLLTPPKREKYSTAMCK